MDGPSVRLEGGMSRHELVLRDRRLNKTKIAETNMIIDQGYEYLSTR